MQFFHDLVSWLRERLYYGKRFRFHVPGAMIYPIYGQGELPQAFCRRAAVKGCLYVSTINIYERLIIC